MKADKSVQENKENAVWVEDGVSEITYGDFNSCTHQMGHFAGEMLSGAWSPLRFPPTTHGQAGATSGQEGR